MKTLILGYGISGRSAQKLLQKEGREVLIVDRDPALQCAGIVLSEADPLDWNAIDQVVVSPGIPPSHPHLLEAKQRKIESIGEIEFAFRRLSNRCIGITGTNGKTTTVLLLQHLFQCAGHRAVALGNIGKSLTSYALNPDPADLLIVELSSFQLETMQAVCLDAALFLNLTPNHLNRHSSFQEYAEAKCRIQYCLKEKGTLWVSQQVVEQVGSLLHSYQRFDGSGSQQSIQAARAIANQFGISEAVFRSALETFCKPPHRIESMGEWEGICFYNDSKASSVDAVSHAVANLEGSIILLAGGVDKGASYRPWIDAFRGKVKRMVVFGQAAAKMEQELAAFIPVSRVENLQEALCCAMKSAKRNEIVLLSPGCSSYDQFQNFEHRGNEFKRMFEERIWIERKLSY